MKVISGRGLSICKDPEPSENYALRSVSVGRTWCEFGGSGKR